MALGYTRQSTLADGDTITAALFNNEYNQLLSAFTYHASTAASSGHRHDGETGQGGSIYRIGDLDFLNKIEADSTNNRWGVWVEVSSAAVEQIRIADGVFSPVTDSDVDLGTSSLYFKDAYIDSITTTGNVAVGGNLTVTGTTTFNGGTITMGDAATDNVVFGADVNSNIIPNTDDTYDLGSASQEWRNLYIDGTANIDSLVADTADINGGTIDGSIIGGTTAAAITGTAITGTSFVIGSADISEAELETIDGVTAGTVAASKAIVVDANKDITGGRNITITGEIDAATLDISGNADIDGTLEADAITIGGITLAETIADTVGAMVSSNTETGIAVSYDDADNTLDFVIGDDAIVQSMIADDAIDSQHYVDGSIDLVHLSANSVDSDQYVDGSIDLVHMSINSIDSDQYVDGSIDLVHMSANSVDSDQYVDGSIDLIHMSANSVDSDQYVDGSIDTVHLADDAVTGAKLADNIDIAGTLDVTGLLTADANVVVAGNLTVNGTTTTLNTATLDVEDKNITINYGAGDTSGSANGAGITIQDAIDASNDATILWDTTNDEFDFSHAINVAGKVTSTGTSVFASLDISGDIDVDGTTNLDVVDIDGAVNMATTALVTGVLTTTATQVATGGITSGSDIISDTDSTDSLGSTGVRWLKGWFDTLTAGTLTVGSGSVTDSSGAISFGNENLTTTGNVGIGTSPDFPLHVSSTGVVLGLNATSGAVSQRFNENGTARFFLSTLNGSNGLAFVNGDGTSERMRIDTSGNVGIGTSSITNNTLGKTTYFGNSTSSITGSSSSASFWLGNNWYYNSGDKFIGTGYANLYTQQSGEHQFLTSTASGTAGAAATFTQVLKIDSSGNVGIGTSSPNVAADLHVADTSDARIWIDATEADTMELYAGTGVGMYNRSNSYLVLGTNNTERMRIDSSGNVGIGGTPARKTHIFDSANGYSLGLQQTSAYNSGNQSGIVFAAPYNAGGEVTDLASIRGGKENTTDDHYGGIVAIWTRANGGSDTERMRIDSTYLRMSGGSAAARIVPNVDNEGYVGDASHRWQAIYAVAGSIDTSDRNEKKDEASLSEAETRVAIVAKGLLKKFRFIHGDDDRLHFGIIAQDLEDAFTAEGLWQ
jgi:cytoskeletal protein CcmA (bactofilin family)